MPTEPRQVPVSPQPDAAERRLHIHGIKEMPAGYDAEVAELFRDLRSATALSETDLAARLGTRSDVVQALEQGALYALPPWPETCRVVNAYGVLLNLDVRPLLRRIYAQLEAGIVELQPKPLPDVPVMVPPETRDYGFASGNSSQGGNNVAGAQAPNPLDIPWPPPQPQAPPPPNAWPNAQGPAPQAPWPNAPGAPRPQHAGWPHPQTPQPQPQAWPASQQMPPPQRPAQPQPPAAPQMQRDGRAPQPSPQQASAPQAQPHRQPQPQPMPRQAAQPPPQAQAQPQPQTTRSPLDVDFAAEPATLPEPEKKRKPALLKWGLGALIISVVAFGLWFALTQAPIPSGLPGLGDGQSGTLDPDDPRSRKQDRLPDAFQTPPQ
jgi:hypothetical protein